LIAEGIASDPGCGRWLYSVSPCSAFYRSWESVFQRDLSAYYRSVITQVSAALMFLAAAWLRLRFHCFGRIWSRGVGPGIGLHPGRLSAAARRMAVNRFLRMPRRIRCRAISLLPMAALAAVFISLCREDRAACEWSFVALYAAHLNLKTFLAVEACSCLQEARCTGALAAELAGSMTPEDVLERRTASLRREFHGPCVAAILSNIGVLVALCLENDSPFLLEEKVPVGALLVAGAVALLVDGYALAWVGMWIGLTSKPNRSAWIRTLAGVVLPPWAALWVLGVPNLGNGYTLNECSAYFVCWFVLGTGLSLIAGTLAKQRLASDLRRRAMESRPD
jgi:hypothetical protein